MTAVLIVSFERFFVDFGDRNVFASQQLVLDPGLLPTASHRLSRSEPTSPLVRASTER